MTNPAPVSKTSLLSSSAVLRCLKILVPDVCYAIMATRTVFEDEDGNELECYLNDALLVYINVARKDDEQSFGFITLDRHDVGKLIEVLQAAKRTMDAEVESLEPRAISASSDSLN